MAAPLLFFGTTAKQTFATYQPKVLSIEPLGVKYAVRLLLYAENPLKLVNDSQWNPPAASCATTLCRTRRVSKS